MAMLVGARVILEFLLVLERHVYGTRPKLVHAVGMFRTKDVFCETFRSLEHSTCGLRTG